VSKRWYVIHAFSGMENQVKRALEDRIKRAGVEEQFGDILVPTETVVEVRNGVQHKVERKFFPGYVLISMEMTDDTWHLVRDVPKGHGLHWRPSG
jgi:transcriptional antiterminator NusG